MSTALILAGGFGTRMGELTKTVPKPMITIKGRTILDHIISRLLLHGVNKIIVNVSYKSEVITDYYNGEVIYYYVPKLLGHFGTIKALRVWLENDDFFVINGDTMTNVDYKDMIHNHRHGTITSLMDGEWRAGGTWLYCNDYFRLKELDVVPYRPQGIEFFDIGDPSKLAKAREYYGEQTTDHVSGMPTTGTKRNTR